MVANADRGIFTPASMFNDLGFTLTPDSMVSFQRALLPLILGSFLILAGNTGFPCMLRFIIWISSVLAPRNWGAWEELRFLLDHPRRCFTLLFPKTPTWWLFWILVGLNGVDLIFFILLDVGRALLSLARQTDQSAAQNSRGDGDWRGRLSNYKRLVHRCVYPNGGVLIC